MSQTTTATNPLGYERIGKLLRGYSIPSIISLIINSLYNMVDQIFIGQGVGFLGNGATNIIAPITMIAIAIGSLFGDGLAAFFSLHLGKNEPEKSAKGLGSAIVAVSYTHLTYIMPYGVECDHYSILGTIQDLHTVENELTGEELTIMKTEVNGLTFDV